MVTGPKEPCKYMGHWSMSALEEQSFHIVFFLRLALHFFLLVRIDSRLNRVTLRQFLYWLPFETHEWSCRSLSSLFKALLAYKLKRKPNIRFFFGTKKTIARRDCRRLEATTL